MKNGVQSCQFIKKRLTSKMMELCYLSLEIALLLLQTQRLLYYFLQYYNGLVTGAPYTTLYVLHFALMPMPMFTRYGACAEQSQALVGQDSSVHRGQCGTFSVLKPSGSQT